MLKGGGGGRDVWGGVLETIPDVYTGRSKRWLVLCGPLNTMPGFMILLKTQHRLHLEPIFSLTSYTLLCNSRHIPYIYVIM